MESSLQISSPSSQIGRDQLPILIIQHPSGTTCREPRPYLNSQYIDRSHSFSLIEAEADGQCPQCISKYCENLALFSGAHFDFRPEQVFNFVSEKSSLRTPPQSELRYQPEIFTTSDTNYQYWNVFGRKTVAPPVRRPIPGIVHPSRTADVALQWIRDCSGNHPICNNGGSHNLPTRVIDIECLCIIETNGATGQYACLSHCWGGRDGRKIIRSTLRSIARFKEALPIGRLPPTFRDAVEFTRALGIRYLWIDSLCIIQDDPKDWEREAAAMADVYMSCTVTLAASNSWNSKGGLFSKCTRKLEAKQIATAQMTDGRAVPVFVSKRPHHDVNSPITRYSSPDNYEYPLNNRGWVLQETLLSPRTIYFLGEEVLFECRAHTRCECGKADSWSPYSKQRFWQHLQTKDTGSLCLEWTDLVLRYSRKKLTYGSDTLPAISGLAKQWLSLDLGGYVAGLWRCDLPRSLMWQTTNGERAKNWRAPTWSWASIDNWTGVYFNTIAEDMVPRVQVIEAHCKPSGPDPTGAVASGHLILRGNAIDGTLAIANRQRRPEVLMHSSKFYCSLDCYHGGKQILGGTTVKVLLMYSQKMHTRKSGQVIRWICLILELNPQGVYERVGITVNDADFRTTGYRARKVDLSELRLLDEPLPQPFGNTETADYYIV